MDLKSVKMSENGPKKCKNDRKGTEKVKKCQKMDRKSLKMSENGPKKSKHVRKWTKKV